MDPHYRDTHLKLLGTVFSFIFRYLSDAGASTTTNGNLILIMKNSDLEGCKALGSSKWKFWTSIKT